VDAGLATVDRSLTCLVRRRLEPRRPPGHLTRPFTAHLFSS
jgi:hypothetical protein